MAACRNVLQEDDILCELYVDRSSNVSDYSKNESMDSDSNIPTSWCKQLRSSVVTSDAETSTIDEESSEVENSNERRDVWCKMDKKSNSLEPQVWIQ
jgi:hypothetical protein